MFQPDPSLTLARAKRNVYVLTLAQAFLGAQLPIIFILGGLAGQSMASNVCFATLPISMIVFGSMTTAPWMSHFMQRFGRQAGFILGSAAGGLGGLICAYALQQSSFTLFLAGSYFTGIYMSAQGFYRFAAVDTAPYEYRGRAISYVMAGGLVAAVLGPTLVKFTAQAMVVPFLGSYLTVLAINAIGVLLFFMLDIPRVDQETSVTGPGRSRFELIKTPRIAVAMIIAMISYALMNLVMTSTPLAVVGCGFTQSHAADIVTAHVLAMFIPSFFTGHLIEKFGSAKIMAVGIILLGTGGIVGLAGIDLSHFYGTLILLGVGWNFSFIGATAMLAASHTPQERGRLQGMNDFLVFGLVTVASVSSGGLMNCSGGSPEQGWYAVNTAMIPLLAIAGGSLLWLFLHERKAEFKSFR
jgi:MFS family permease